LSELWNKLISTHNEIESIINHEAIKASSPSPLAGTYPALLSDTHWHNSHVRRAHVTTLDARETKGLWMMHVCVFPVPTNDAPIYGFDVVAGKNKMTGAFHDFSPTLDPYHPLLEQYRNWVEGFVPIRSRTLPDWAQAIFSDKMIAASNVNTLDEANDVLDLAVDNLRKYMVEVPKYTGPADAYKVVEAQNFYCDNQRKNPHTPRVMESLGMREEDVTTFCQDLLFPKINI